uniref:Transposase Tc1-like domain-containing protein n=1 Tax=Acrobeloides nanus TaxID=290746 RepID=A0A914CDJ0_9BILA
MPRSGRPRTSRTLRLIKVVRERIRRNPRRSMRKMVKELRISEGSVRNIVKKDLRLRLYKLKKTHLLTKKNQIKDVKRS